MEKDPHISEPTQFKPALFNGQLYVETVLFFATFLKYKNIAKKKVNKENYRKSFRMGTSFFTVCRQNGRCSGVRVWERRSEDLI